MNGIKKLRITNYELRIAGILCVLCILCGAALNIKAQSTEQNFPTAITTNEISGKIPARDIGDARLTTYFYTFNAAQGDVFLNVVTTNLNGDIDVFTADNLRPLTKITLYADTSNSETGRVIYLRQPAKLILRIEGRTPNDDAATFQIKFAGSFAPAVANENAGSEMPTVKSENQTDVRVNSVGTIIEIKPKPIPKPKEETIAETKTKREAKTKQRTEIADAKKREENKKPEAEKENPVENENEIKPTVVVTDELSERKAETETPAEKNLPEKTEENQAQAETEKNAVEEKTIVKKESKENKMPSPVKPLPPSALENIRLIVLFKDGTKIERPMSEVLKVGVDKGVLTVITKDGTIGRYSILDVEKMTIE